MLKDRVETMKKTASKIALLLLIVSFASAFIPRIYAEEDPYDPWVLVYDTSGNISDKFNLGDTINVTAYCATVYLPFNITITAPNSTEVYKKTGINTNWWIQVFTNMTDALGEWLIMLDGTDKTTIGGWAAGTYFVIPQVPFGAIGALSASIAGFGLVKIRRRKK